MMMRMISELLHMVSTYSVDCESSSLIKSNTRKTGQVAFSSFFMFHGRGRLMEDKYELFELNYELRLVDGVTGATLLLVISHLLAIVIIAPGE